MISFVIPAAPQFTLPEVNYAALSPVIVMVVTAILGVLIEAFGSRDSRYHLQVGLSTIGLLIALFTLGTLAVSNQGITVGGSMVIDGPAIMLQGSILAMSLVALALIADRFGKYGPDAFTPSGASIPGSPMEAAITKVGMPGTEVFPLLSLTITGMLIYPASGDLLTMFVGLEIMSLPLYVLTGLARRRRMLSQEASLKYFLLGAFSSAFFLFGSALLYGWSGSVDLNAIFAAGSKVTELNSLVGAGVILVCVGLLFKVGAVPFHAWTPDAYTGAPTPLTAFMSAATKVAAFGALMRVLYVALPGLRWNWEPFIAVLAVLTMVVGAVLSITQVDIKRMLAYSSVTHAGFIMVGLLAVNDLGVRGVLVYVACYGFVSLGAFGMMSLVRADGLEVTSLADWAGLGRRHPAFGVVFAFLMFAMVGLPLTAGFTAKYAAFSAAIANGGAWLAVIGVLMSLVAAFAYLRVVVMMFMSPETSTDQGQKDSSESPASLALSLPTVLAVTVASVITLALGIAPGALLEIASRYSQFILR